MGIEDIANQAENAVNNNEQLQSVANNEHVQNVLQHLNPEEAKQVLNSDKVQEFLKSDKVEEVSDKVIHSIADLANKITGGKFEQQINQVRENLDKNIGNE